MLTLPETPEKPPFKEWYRRGRRVHVNFGGGHAIPAILLLDAD
jgi:hypothetical protein